MLRSVHVALLLACAVATFLGAALSFGVQPLVGRQLLPALGGTPAVWVTCLAFFQLALFVGYALVHLTTRWLRLRAQLALILVCALAVALHGPLLLPKLGAPTLELPVLLVLLFLLQHVAPAYVVVTTSAPLFSRAYAHATQREPYLLYAVSNAGSFLGLLGYPLWMEPSLDLRAQASAWSWGFGAWLVASALAALLLVRSPAALAEAPSAAAPARASRREAASWLALSAAPSALLAAISNHITIDVAPMPVLWVLPLALYLITFIVAFARPNEAARELESGALIACAVALPILLMPGNETRLPVMLGVPLATLFFAALVCHRKLAALRPEPTRATLYYLVIAAGGALGGGLVAFVAPLVFVEPYELVLSLLAVFALQLAFSRRRDPRIAPTGRERLAWLGFGLALPVLCATLWVQTHALGRPGHVLARTRNFFGPLQVIDTARERVLVHGRTDQGKALRAPGHERDPISYFGPDTGVGRALRTHALEHARAIGVLGLGIGTLAAYAQPRDTVSFFEIDPAMVQLARRYFRFLEPGHAAIRITLGDGRLALARSRERFDLLVLDVFSSDAVPPHLLTVEAFAEYLHHLAPGGLLLANISNRHVRFERVIAGSANAHHLAYTILESPADRAHGLARARWAILSRDRSALTPLLGAPAQQLAVDHPVTWTDDHSSLLSIAF